MTEKTEHTAGPVLAGKATDGPNYAGEIRTTLEATNGRMEPTWRG